MGYQYDRILGRIPDRLVSDRINRIAIKYDYLVLLDGNIKWDYWIWFFFQIRGLLWCVPGRGVFFDKPRGLLWCVPRRDIFFFDVSWPQKIIFGYLWTRCFEANRYLFRFGHISSFVYKNMGVEN